MKIEIKGKIISISDREKACLKELVEYYNSDANCLYFRGVAKGAEITEAEARRAVRSLARKGLAEYQRGLFDEEGIIAGSGYCATREGAMILNACKDCKNSLADMDTGQCQQCWERDAIKRHLVEMESMGVPTGHIAKVSLYDLEIIEEFYKKNGVPKKLTASKVLAEVNKLVKPYQRHYDHIL